MAAVSESRGCVYDVFLSFRGEDTRLRFSGNLDKALKEEGMKTFFDGNRMSGEEITESTMKAIEQSRLFIIILSQNYASSSFCLDELVHIIRFSKDNGRPVLPVFFHVDPSDVRIHGEELAKHDSESNKVMNWREALSQAANLSGLTFKDGDGYEYELIEKIVDYVSKKINPSVADRLVGLEHRSVLVKKLLDATSDDGVHAVGIWGMGGIGKTTIARAVYNDILADQFDASCFLENVGENATTHGLVGILLILLSEMLSGIRGEKDIKLSSVEQGSSIIKQRLSKKKVLLVLDDVTESEQLQAIVGSPNWFGPGSRVIITTQDQQLLRAHSVVQIYEVPKLTDGEALELLCWKAFKTNRVYPDYIEAMLRAMTYASGIPLVLEVIGSNLYGKKSEEWLYTLDLYEKIPVNNIGEVVKVSYDALDILQQEVFRAIACSFNGLKSAEIENKLCAHDNGYCIKPHIEALVEKSLIKIDEHSCVKMHDLIQQMGRNIN